MANEVIIEEYALTIAKGADGNYLPIVGDLVTSQVLTIATLSAQLNARTNYIRIQSKDIGFWYIPGNASASAVANTAGNRWLPADQFRDIPVRPGVDTYIDTAA